MTIRYTKYKWMKKNNRKEIGQQIEQDAWPLKKKKQFLTIPQQKKIIINFTQVQKNSKEKKVTSIKLTSKIIYLY